MAKAFDIDARIKVVLAPGRDPKSLTSVSFATDLVLRRPEVASKDTPDRAHSHACARWNVLRGPFGAPQDEVDGCWGGRLTIEDSALVLTPSDA